LDPGAGMTLGIGQNESWYSVKSGFSRRAGADAAKDKFFARSYVMQGSLFPVCKIFAANLTKKFHVKLFLKKF
jgi:hypothetical protein